MGDNKDLYFWCAVVAVVVVVAAMYVYSQQTEHYTHKDGGSSAAAYWPLFVGIGLVVIAAIGLGAGAYFGAFKPKSSFEPSPSYSSSYSV